MIHLPSHAARSCLRLPSLRQTRIICRDAFFTTTTARRSLATVTRSNEYNPLGDNIPLSTTKPKSARPVETRKSQLIRTYTSLLRTTPLILFFQHSNLTAVEWAAVRRELKKVLESVPESTETDSSGSHHLSSQMQLQVLRTNMFSVALKIVEFHKPSPTSSTCVQQSGDEALSHDLSAMAYKAIQDANTSPDSTYAQLEPLLVGPLAALVLPAVSPAHLAAALTVLAPVPGKFPAPTRKKNPGYHDPICQNGLAKLQLVGGRIEGKVFDQSGLSWVGSIQGGMDGLRCQLISVLQGAGLGLTASLEGSSRNLWLALEGRRTQLEDDAKQE